METLAISAANLNTIEKNLGAVANELSGVITNVSTVNNQVNKVENEVATLNNEVKNLVKEIRETTIISNARQSIMYNNEQIDKKFSYFDSVRRTTESLLDAITSSTISKKSLKDLNQQIILNNPNYWLANALTAVSYWILNDKENADKETKNALQKNAKKTSLFFTIINLKLNRQSTSINWLKKYLSLQNPQELDKDFITILDLVSNGTLGNEAKEIVLDKINVWFERLKNDKEIHDRQKEIWTTFIEENESNDIYMPYLEIYAKNVSILKHNLAVTSSYYSVLKELEKVMNEENTIKGIDEILNNLIYDYEQREQVYALDNLRNNLIIACNGDTEEANKLFKKQESLYHDKVDIITILSNIVIFNTTYKVTNNTKKIALSLVKDYIIESYLDKNNSLNQNIINLDINGFTTEINETIDREKISRELNEYVEKEYSAIDKDLIAILLILNIIGIIGIFITLNNKVLSSLMIAIILIGDIFLMIKLNNRTHLRNNAKNKLKNSTSNALESALAEIIDYENLIKNDNEEYQNLITFLTNIETQNYVRTNNERNIKVGE